jgi:hypothetical protein
MIHNANELTSKHRRYMLSGFAPGLRALGTPGAGPSSDPGPAANPARLAGGSAAAALGSPGGGSAGAGSSLSDTPLLHTASGSGGRLAALGAAGGAGAGAGAAWTPLDARHRAGKAQMTAQMKAQAEEAQRELREAQREVRRAGRAGCRTSARACWFGACGLLLACPSAGWPPGLRSRVV